LSTAQFIVGRVNVNTASAAVLAALPGISSSPDLAQTLVNYRETNPDKLITVAWVADALGQNNQTVLSALQAIDCITNPKLSVYCRYRGAWSEWPWLFAGFGSCSIQRMVHRKLFTARI